MLLYRFRWVYCQLERQRHCLPPNVRGILDDLPDTLDETYAQVLKDINEANQNHAVRLLHCLTFNRRHSASICQRTCGGSAVDFDAAQQGGIPKLNPNWWWADYHQAVLSTCSSLVMIGVLKWFNSHISTLHWIDSQTQAETSPVITSFPSLSTQF